MSGQSGSGVPTKIVVGTDGSPTAERAVSKAKALAKAVGAELIIVTRLQQPRPVGRRRRRHRHRLELGGRRAVGRAEAVAKRGGRTGEGGRRRQGLLPGRGRRPLRGPAPGDRGPGADLLVVGSKGMHSTARFLLGPIANKVSRRVPCDLLIVETSDSTSPAGGGSAGPASPRRAFRHPVTGGRLHRR